MSRPKILISELLLNYSLKLLCKQYAALLHNIIVPEGIASVRKLHHLQQRHHITESVLQHQEPRVLHLILAQSRVDHQELWRQSWQLHRVSTFSS